MKINKLASIAHISPDHFSRLFVREFGTTPLQFIIAARMTRAKMLLATEDMSIAEVSDSVGVDDPAYFCRLFKKNTGMSPMAYRQKYNRSTSVSDPANNTADSPTQEY